MKSMSTAPKDRAILLRVNHTWIEGCWCDGEWQVESLPSHGCGCCADRNDEPEGWLELPSTEIEE